MLPAVSQRTSKKQKQSEYRVFLLVLHTGCNFKGRRKSKCVLTDSRLDTAVTCLAWPAERERERERRPTRERERERENKQEKKQSPVGMEIKRHAWERTSCAASLSRDASPVSSPARVKRHHPAALRDVTQGDAVAAAVVCDATRDLGT